MKKFFYSKKQWILNISDKAIIRAYTLSKEVRNIQQQYRCYIYSFPKESKSLRLSVYMSLILQEYIFSIYIALIQFEASRFVISLIDFILYKTDYKNESYSKIHFYIGPLNIQFCRYLIESVDSTTVESSLLKRKIIWITAILSDLDALHKKIFIFSLWNSFFVSQYDLWYGGRTQLKSISYETIGFIPRSIIRTFFIIKKQLVGLYSSITLTEFRLIRYQTIASVHYLMCLIFIPWLISNISKPIVQSTVLYYWNINHYDLLSDITQEQQMLIKVEEVKELEWLKIILDNRWPILIKEYDQIVNQKIFELVQISNEDSINTITNFITSCIQTVLILFILIWGKERLDILNSWFKEAFYSLTDTMKAFSILLLSDLCIGFHSTKVWKMLIPWILHHLGFSDDCYFAAYLISTIPVILNTLLKYWIFRHLNRISPSLVVTYHTMKE